MSDPSPSLNVPPSSAGPATLRLAVGSRRAPKLEAVHAAAVSLLPTLRVAGAGFENYALWTGEVESGVEETPLSLESLVAGARQRAHAALTRATADGFECHFGLGLEGGAVRGADGRLFLQSWVCVTDGAREGLGAGPVLPLPDHIASRLLAGESLAQVIDEVAGATDVRSNEGTFGVLTRNRLSRSAVFATALMCAFAPFDHPEFYPAAEDAARSGAPPAPPAQPRVTGLGGVFFKSVDPEALWAWYEKHLGMAREDGAVLFRWRGAAPGGGPGMTVWSLFKQDTKYFDPSPAPMMLNYRVADLDAVLAALAGEGVAINPKREDSEYGRFAWIFDPEGNKIELWQPPAGS
jgi:inosine/xanthosine triphosphatase